MLLPLPLPLPPPFAEVTNFTFILRADPNDLREPFDEALNELREALEALRDRELEGALRKEDALRREDAELDLDLTHA